ncbi:hypothetical protein DK254_00250 [Pseudomonas sp. RW407]|uniref:hypothetical protein n=1 Tax=Pseudomonas sp. RW407 TaxID=2202894 RepID=UPI000D6F806D|nr:hypothetical protein [Pseudomonas sp. RW407]PWU30718.1 hypothetical protein DK254_11670 [Pseudomonas sp. RW407]PWU32151.1 hypothetical protein DK254_00250 [Pseudomonas sp. RW407]
MAVLSQAIGKEFIKALGLDGKHVTAIKLEMKTNALVAVDVSYCPEREQVEDIFEIVQRYELVEKPE